MDGDRGGPATGLRALFDYRGPADIFAEHARLSGYGNNGSRAFDISALADLDQAAYDQLAPTCWPRPAIPVANEPQDAGRFFTVSGRAQFIATLPAMPDSGGAGEERLQLNTGRLRDQWHTMTRTGRVAKLMRHRDFSVSA